MAQTAVNNEPTILIEGKTEGTIHNDQVGSAAAAASVFPGKMVVINAVTEVGMGAQSCKLVSAAGDVVNGDMLGVVKADTTKEATSAAYQEYVQYDAVPYLVKGRIWVEVPSALADLGAGVYVRHANGAANPGAGLTAGSFRHDANVDYTQITSGGVQWRAYKLVGSKHYALLEINFPG